MSSEVAETPQIAPGNQVADEPAVTTNPEPTKTLTAPEPQPGAIPKIPATPDILQTTTTAAPLQAEPKPEPVVAPAAATPTPAPEEKKVEDIPEPQSSLTNRFTQTEWEALKTFRADLPQIFADGYPDDPKAKDTAITLWGVRIDPHNPKDARVSVVLMKFLRARNLSVPDAREMLVSTLRWRHSFNIEAVLKEEFPQDIFGHVGCIQGHDKEGRPVVYNFYGVSNVQEVFSDVQRFLRWRVALQEKSIALLDFAEIDQMVQIHDYEGASFTNRDANSKNAASEATSIFQGHYPECLYRKFFINIPTLLTWVFTLFKPLISANTLAKMTVVGHGHHAIQKALLPVIDIKQLPERYGGEAEDKVVQ